MAICAIPLREEIFGPGLHPASCIVGTVSLPWGRATGSCRVDQTHPSSTEVKESVDLYLYSSSRASWPFLG